MATTYYTDHVILNTAGTNTIEPKLLQDATTRLMATGTINIGVTIGASDVIAIADVPPGVTMGFCSFGIQNGGTTSWTAGILTNTTLICQGISNTLVNTQSAFALCYQTTTVDGTNTRFFLTNTLGSVVTTASLFVTAVLEYSANP